MKYKSVFDISPAKKKRLEGRICRVRCTVELYDGMGHCDVLKLDTAKYDNIGMTRKSLDTWLKKWIIRSPHKWYWVPKWNINPL